MNSNKVALVTGANQGIGLACVEELLEKGFKVILTARDEEKGQKAFKRFESNGKCFFHQLDIRDNSSIKKVKEYIESEFGRLNILVNNAAINYDTWQNVLDANLEEVSDTLDANLMGAWRVSQAFIPLMKRNGSGNIVNVSSGAGNLSSQNGSTPAYSMSKLALNALTMQLSSALRKDKILVNSVCPGWVRTSMGGLAAPRSANSAAKSIISIALLEDISKSGNFYRDEEIIEW